MFDGSATAVNRWFNVFYGSANGFNVFYGSVNTVKMWFECILWFCKYCEQVISACFMVLQIL